MMMMMIIQFISMIIVITSMMMMMMIIIVALVGCDVDSTVATHNLGLRAPPPHPDEPIWWCSLCNFAAVFVFLSVCVFVSKLFLLRWAHLVMLMGQAESQKAKTFRIARFLSQKRKNITFRIKRVNRVNCQICDKCPLKVVLQDFG